jgi:hypothetical protein
MKPDHDEHRRDRKPSPRSGLVQPLGGGNDEERGHVAVPIERHRRAPRHASPLSLHGLNTNEEALDELDALRGKVDQTHRQFFCRCDQLLLDPQRRFEHVVFTEVAYLLADHAGSEEVWAWLRNVGRNSDRARQVAMQIALLELVPEDPVIEMDFLRLWQASREAATRWMLFAAYENSRTFSRFTYTFIRSIADSGTRKCLLSMNTSSPIGAGLNPCNKAGAGDAGIAPRLQVEHHWPGAPDLIRWAQAEP